jgi:hypothetical protein
MDASSSTEDLKKCTAVELRAIIALGHRAQSALDALSVKVPYPSRLPPSLVIAFLPLHELAPALRVSTAWRKQAEEVFRAIATRLGLARSTSWRDVVRESAKLRWVHALDDKFEHLDYDLVDYDLVDARTVVNTTGDDGYFIGRGVEIDTDVLVWELRTTRGLGPIVDACGFAIIDGGCADQSTLDPNDVLKIFIWNSNGQSYDLDSPHFDSIKSRVTEFEAEHVPENNSLYDSGATLRIAANRGEPSAFFFKLEVLGADDKWSQLDRLRMCTNQMRLCKRIIVAPIVRMYHESRAELIRFRRARTILELEL